MIRKKKRKTIRTRNPKKFHLPTLPILLRSITTVMSMMKTKKWKKKTQRNGTGTRIGKVAKPGKNIAKSLGNRMPSGSNRISHGLRVQGRKN